MNRRYRRSPDLVCYWRDGTAILHNVRTGSRVNATSALFGALSALDEWRSPVELASTIGGRRAALERLLDALAAVDLVERGPIASRRRRTAWSVWGPTATLFHFGTRNVRFERDRPGHAPARMSSRQAAGTGAPDRAADAVRDESEFARVLLSRRTWRRFGRTPAAFESLAKVMGLTFGVQRRMRVGATVVALRTSPSAGARQALEAYVLARNIKGLPQGLYHYDGSSRTLTRLAWRGSAAAAMRRYLPQQEWYAAASCLVLITAVLARTVSRYTSAHAYRTILLEAGHFCQTFCLAATSEGLAPFCSAALADSAIEQDLGVDPDVEPVLYAAGFGTRPRGSAWAPAPPGERLPRMC